MKPVIIYFLLFFIASQGADSYAQEHTSPLRYNPVVQKASKKKQSALFKTTSGSLSLPFFEDFTGYDPLPDTTKWVEHEVYINNTMCVSPISRGVATFDALNADGIPYDTVDNYAYIYCDSLTSQPIDLSNNHPSDSVYLSFFYQPQGNGFFPLLGDSLMLYMRKSFADWTLVWSVPGNYLQPFQQVLIPITDTNFFYNAFQFRFVNIAALNYCDAVWNVDYIKLAAGRSMNDTIINDVAFSSNPSFMLNDYSFMTYKQFMANPSGERATQFADSVHNNDTASQILSYAYSAREITTNTFLDSSAYISVTTAAQQQTEQLTTSPVYTAMIPLTGAYNKVIFENTFFFQTSDPADVLANDTIVEYQIFDNYLAYDDGTAEQCYYLTQYPTLPAYLAIDYHLNVADTVQGIAIYFGRQAPLPSYKFFSIMVYGSLNGINGGTYDNVLYKEDNLNPGYVDTVNHFWIYSFSHPLALPAGLFYIGTMQPAYGGADSLYLGLDVNRVGNNHAYYNVGGSWNPSQVSGAIMMRPILGQAVVGTGINNVVAKNNDWYVSPNPANEYLHIDIGTANNATYVITDLQGRTMLSGSMNKSGNLDISSFVPGMYFVTLYFDGVASTPKKFIKQ